MKRSLLLLGLVIVLSSFVISSQAAAGSIISLNFASGRSGVQYPMDSGMTAGVAPATNWNNLFGGNNTATDLLDSMGTATTATVTWTTTSTHGVTTPSGSSDGNIAMMETYIDHSVLTTAAVTVSGIPANSSFDVYVYFDGNNSGHPRSAGYTIDDQTYWTTDVSDFGGTFFQATGTTEATATVNGNYAIFSGLTGSEFTLSVDPSHVGDIARGAVNGIQIVCTSVPEPGSVVLILTAFIAIGFFRKLKK